MHGQRLNQMQVAYSPEEDRVQLLVSAGAQHEFRCWLTRRFMKMVWPAIRQALVDMEGAAGESSVAPSIQPTAANPQHQNAMPQTVPSGTPSQPPVTAAQIAEPPQAVLITRAQLEPLSGKRYRVALHPQTSHGIDMVMEPQVFHAFGRLLKESVSKADWDLDQQAVVGGKAASQPRGVVVEVESQYQFN
ncbi:MAG: hypothetical protein HQM06_15490 [Magnetococcales bacterium]|nr:hypothetical protein [Magnetococcales bacterium]